MIVDRRMVNGLVVSVTILLVLSVTASVTSTVSAALSEDWQVMDSMENGRTQAVVLQDNDGVAYIIGGVGNMVGGSYSPAVDNVESYDPSTGEWVDLAPMPYGVRGAAGALGDDGRIYVFGGANDTVATHMITQIYDPATDAWTLGTDVPLSIWEAKAARLSSNEILVAGGEGAGTDTQIYDIEDDSWTAGGSLPSGVMAGALLNLDYNCYYIGGSNLGYSAVDTVYVYTIWSGTWSVAGTMPVPTAAHAAVIGPDGLIYIVGGADSAMNVGAGYNTSYCFNPNSGDWIRLEDLPVGTRYSGAVASADGSVQSLGGNNDTVVLTQTLSLEVMEVSASLSSSEAQAGDSILVTLGVEFANRDAVTGSDYYAFFLTSEGIPVNPEYAWVSGPYPSLAFEIEVPTIVEPGTHSIVVQWYVSTVSGGVELPQQELPLTVVDSPTLDERIDALENQLADLEADLADVLSQLDAMSSDNNDTESTLLDEIESLQDYVGLLEDQITLLESDLGALLDSLEETQDSVDGVQTSVDSKAENSMFYAVVGLLIVVIVMMVVMMIMGRRPKTPEPEPLPEPPEE